MHIRRSSLLATLLTSAALAASQAVAQGAVELPREIAVDGSGEVRAAPDRAELQMSVIHSGSEIAPLEAQVNSVVRNTLKALTALGAKDKDLQSTAVSIQPEYVWDEQTRSQQLKGYRVSRELTVQLQSIDQLGAYLQAATRAGVNQIAPPRLTHSQMDRLREEALIKATANAQRRAGLIAETLGVRLGAPRLASTLGDADASPISYGVRKLEMMTLSSGPDDMAVQPGEIVVDARISVRFELIPPAH